jgi:hypothetical protein
MNEKSVSIRDFCIQPRNSVHNLHLKAKTKLNSVALVRERTILTERPPLVGEVSATKVGTIEGYIKHIFSVTLMYYKLHIASHNTEVFYYYYLQ